MSSGKRKWKLPCSSTAIETWTRRGLDCLPNAVAAPLKVETSGAALPSPCQLAAHVPSPVAGQNFREGVCTAPLGQSSAVTCILLPPFVFPAIAYHDKCQLSSSTSTVLSVTTYIPPNHPQGNATSSRPNSPRLSTRQLPPAARWTSSRQSQPDMTQGGYGQHHVGLGF